MSCPRLSSLDAVTPLRAGQIIAYPTEGVFGLGCDPFNQCAVEQLMALKGRDAAKGLIVLAAEMIQIVPLLDTITTAQRRELNATWPGPVTWIVPAHSTVPDWLTGGRDTLAVRVSAHPVCRELCLAAGPIVSTSANRSGEPAARSAAEVDAVFDGRIAGIVEGELGGREKPTEIRDLRSGKVLRAG